MSDFVIIGLFSIASLTILTISIWQNGRRINAVDQRTIETHDLVEKLELSVNSRMDAYLEKIDEVNTGTIESARLAGTMEERALGAARAAAVEVARAVVTADRPAPGEGPTTVEAAVSVRIADATARLADETTRLADETTRVANAAEEKNT